MPKVSVEERILRELHLSERELHTEEVAERVGLVRHTVSKYLQILQAKGAVQVRRVGNAKLWRDPLATLRIRELTVEDLPRLVELERTVERVYGLDDPRRLAYLEQTARAAIQRSESAFGLAAETRGRLVGFILGEARLWEFGRGERIGWIEAIAVSPEFQGHRIGRRLGEELMRRFEGVGVRRVRTLVDWYNGKLLAYFKTLGFDILKMIPLERQLEPAAPPGKERE